MIRNASSDRYGVLDERRRMIVAEVRRQATAERTAPEGAYHRADDAGDPRRVHPGPRRPLRPMSPLSGCEPRTAPAPCGSEWWGADRIKLDGGEHGEDPRRECITEEGEPGRRDIQRRSLAAQLTAAGAVRVRSPATMPISRAITSVVETPAFIRYFPVRCPRRLLPLAGREVVELPNHQAIWFELVCLTSYSSISISRALLAIRGRSGWRCRNRTHAFQRRRASSLPAGRSALGPLEVVHRLHQPVVHAAGVGGAGTGELRLGPPFGDDAGVVGAVVVGGQPGEDVARRCGGRRTLRRNWSVRASSSVMRRRLVPGIDGQDVEADALGLARLVEQSIALGLAPARPATAS